MSLNKIYQPIEEELTQVEELLRTSVGEVSNHTASKIADIVFKSPGKRIRPALLILCGKAASQAHPLMDLPANQKLIKVATAFELIHMASLVHDDVIDRSTMRHSKPTINAIWGEDASVAFGDYLYSLSSSLTTECKNLRLHECMSQATRDMCEGELLQVCERNNLSLTKESYLNIIRKKTAGLFASACEAGSIVYHADLFLQQTLREFGMFLGTAFQIIDDYLDLVGEEQKLGKAPGQDIEIGKLTLPLLYLLEETPENEKNQMRALLSEADNPAAFQKIKLKLSRSRAIPRTIENITSFMSQATQKLENLPPSSYKESLENLMDFIIERALSYATPQV